MAISFLLIAIYLISPSFISASTQKPKHFSCNTSNPIDRCSGWCDITNGRANRKTLADCGIGFGKNANGGKAGSIYVVTRDDDPDSVNPPPGTLRYAVIQTEPLWIMFKQDTNIVLQQELIMNSHKTIDGRGRNVKITGCSGITVQSVHNIIITGVTVTKMVPCGDALVRSSPQQYGYRGLTDGDGISIFAGSKDIWIDHCTLSDCSDGLIDIVLASTAITVSNCHFSNHNEVMLLGHSDSYIEDKIMQVTIAYNYFGENLNQRMPRGRHGYIELINNYYPNGWGMYAVGGSACPTIISIGNIFVAPNNRYSKQVTHHQNEDKSKWEHCTWSSDNDMMLNGAFFTTSGSSYARAMSMGIESTSDVVALTANAGALY
ncbi:hypothetical protein CASFOL_027883 [Castilleja foliolosa]|uniref:Pectate lyase n=1 Tax=Castilleja foliolosa TaxID=1961234 RepID=A0ABD3CH82_9LAMI